MPHLSYLGLYVQMSPILQIGKGSKEKLRELPKEETPPLTERDCWASGSPSASRDDPHECFGETASPS